MRVFACVIFDAIIRNEKTQRILSESTLISPFLIYSILKISGQDLDLSG